jgi:hypothetical protein
LDLNSSHYLISKQLVQRIYPTKKKIVQNSRLAKNSIAAKNQDDIKVLEDWTFHKLINIEISLRVVLSNFKYERVYIKHYKRNSGPSRGHPSHKILKDGFQAIKDIKNLKSEFFIND